jgi:polyphosphate glucokinase
MGGAVLGVDVGGSSIKYASVDAASGSLVTALDSIPTPQPANAAALCTAIGTLAAALPAGTRIGVALPSVIRRGIVCTAANLDASLIGTDFRALLHAQLRRTVICLNDADAAGLAEMRFGAARAAAGTVMMLTFGTGIGSALFIDGVLVPNTELGHLEIDGEDAELRASARARHDEGLSWEQWAPRVNVYLDHINRLFWPELIVLGGGISEHFAQFSPLLRSRAPLRAAQLGPGAGVVGAALAAADQHG